MQILDLPASPPLTPDAAPVLCDAPPKRHPRDMGQLEVSEFLTWLATEGNVSASTQRQALIWQRDFVPMGAAKTGEQA